MSSFSGIEIGKRSLNAHSQSIGTAGHNITNADTEGYSRQRVTVRAFDPIHRPDLSRAETPGQIGQGAAAQSIERIRDELLDGRIAAETSKETYWGTREKYYSMIEKIYNEPADVSVRTNMDKFWDSWQELSVYPESEASRRSVLSRGESFVNSVQQRYGALNGIGTMLNADIEGTVKQVNEYSQQIAQLNSEIVRSKAMGDNPNDLLDRRDLMVEKLSGLVNITTDTRDSDEFMVHIEGRILVQGKVSRSFDVVPVTDNSGYSKIVWSDTKQQASFSQGTLGALIELRDTDLRQEIQNLDTMTLHFTDLVNSIHREGIGGDNKTGLDFFVQKPFVTDVKGNYDRNGDGDVDSSYIFRMTGTNKLESTEKIGLRGTMLISGQQGNIPVQYFPEDTVQRVVDRINDSNGEVKAFLDRDGKLVLKASSSASMDNPDFVIRHVEDSGYFLSGYAGLLRTQGSEGAYDFNRPNAVDVLVQSADSGAAASYAAAPVLNPSSWIAVNDQIVSHPLSIAAGFPDSTGFLNTGDGSAAVEIASIRNNPVMIGKSRTFDDYFADSVVNVGLKGEQAQINLLSRSASMEDLRAMRDAVSGVNIDEELADIIKFQHGYNAAAKYITVIDELLDTVINRLGV